MQVHTDAECASAGAMWRLVSALAQAWRSYRADLAAAYRPEKHYMRGPGPKWHAKHAHGAPAH